MPNINDDVVASIRQSQGRLYAWQIDSICGWLLDVWILEDHHTGKWTLKHTVDYLEIFGRHCHKDFDLYSVFAIHPEHNLIFLSDGKEMTVSYDMDNQDVQVICTSQEFLHGLPYTPCFAE
ncbi:hypothetical protein ZWY2020_054377 [Hordeum vulgare]|nr:hypothetical protein ZWY2020_054377 [Hordeum vulgare]